MKEGYVIRDQSLPHFITATIIDWIDVFSRKNYRDVVIECFDYCIKNKGMILYGYVIMSNHIHFIAQSKEGKLSDLIRDFKKFTAKSILEKIQTEPESRREWMLERFKLATESHSRNKNFQFWQYGNHPEEIYTNKFMWSKLDYIHLNPVRAGGTVYSYGRYNGSYSPASGSLGPLGDGVLLKLDGQTAANFISERTANYPTEKFTVKVNASRVKSYYNKLYNNGTPLRGKTGYNAYGRFIGTYNLVGPGGNNCTTLTYKALNYGGANIRPAQTPAGMLYDFRQINYINQGYNPSQRLWGPK